MISFQFSILGTQNISEIVTDAHVFSGASAIERKFPSDGGRRHRGRRSPNLAMMLALGPRRGVQPAAGLMAALRLRPCFRFCRSFRFCFRCRQRCSRLLSRRSGLLRCFLDLRSGLLRRPGIFLLLFRRLRLRLGGSHRRGSRLIGRNNRRGRAREGTEKPAPNRRPASLRRRRRRGFWRRRRRLRLFRVGVIGERRCRCGSRGGGSGGRGGGCDCCLSCWDGGSGGGGGQVRVRPNLQL